MAVKGKRNRELCRGVNRLVSYDVVLVICGGGAGCVFGFGHGGTGLGVFIFAWSSN